MKYMMFVVADPDAAAEAEPSEDDLTIEEWLADVESRGSESPVMPFARSATQPRSESATGRCSSPTGRSLSPKSGSPASTSSECDNLDEAIAIAARHPQANGGKLELRPFWTDED
jgi:hypothetical protein